jgi:hypothetical protein
VRSGGPTPLFAPRRAQGVSGVLPRKDFATYYGSDAALLPGQLIDCVVTKPAAGGGQAQVRGGRRAGGRAGRRAGARLICGSGAWGRAAGGLPPEPRENEGMLRRP